MEKFRFYVIAITLSFTAFAHGASHPQASQDWVRAFVSNQIQRAGSAGGCGCSSGSSQGGGCGCGTGTAGCASDCAGTDAQDLKNWVKSYVATNVARQVSVVHSNNATWYSLGGKTVMVEDSTEPALVLRDVTADAMAAGLTNRMIFAYDATASSDGLSVYRTGAALLCEDGEGCYYPGPGRGTAVFSSREVNGSTLMYPVGSTNSAPVCEVCSTAIQPSRAERLLSGGTQ